MRARSLAQVRTALQNPEIRVISVDVFDTLLLRDSMPESNRFKEIAELQARAISEAIESDVSPIDFFLLRKEAARTVYSTRTRVNSSREGSWEEIFELIFLSLEIPTSSGLLDVCREIELNYEKKRLTFNTPLSNLLTGTEPSDKRVVCLSDMYFRSEHIKYLIDCTAGHETAYDVYSSADHGYGKASGGLFHRLAEDSGASLNQIAHCGDDWITDYRIPRSLGVHAIHMPRAISWRLARLARAYRFRKAHPTP